MIQVPRKGKERNGLGLGLGYALIARHLLRHDQQASARMTSNSTCHSDSSRQTVASPLRNTPDSTGQVSNN